MFDNIKNTIKTNTPIVKEFIKKNSKLIGDKIKETSIKVKQMF